MNDEPEASQSAGSGALRGLRLVAALAIALLAMLALLFVFDVIPRDALADLATKVVLVALIVGAAAGGIALLVGPRR